jgi:hypothetical protein
MRRPVDNKMKKYNSKLTPVKDIKGLIKMIRRPKGLSGAAKALSRLISKIYSTRF